MSEKPSDQPRRKRKVVGEDEYVEAVEKIIQRDFFPDLPKLREQSEYAHALESNDLEKLKEISERRSLNQGQRTSFEAVTPSTFETPTINSLASTPSYGRANQSKEKNKENEKSEEIDTEIALDQFMTRHISEDEASFHELMKAAERQWREKNAYLLDKEADSKAEAAKNLALTDGSEPKKLQAWPYRVQNYLMYCPDGVKRTSEELLKDRGVNPREICNQNTRYKANSLDEQKKVGAAVVAAATSAKQAVLAQSGKIDVDGKPYVDEGSPAVNGYGFIDTPQIEPGVDMTPVMTWGTIEGTPMRIEGDATPGPVFKIPDVPEREKLGLKLSKEISRKQRETKKSVALSAVKASPRSSFMSPSEKLNMLSPAAKRLVSKGKGSKSVDIALRQSYSPSPLHVATTPKSTTNATPGKVTYTSITPTHNAVPSLTDNMLNLPK